jgi:glycerol kinase
MGAAYLAGLAVGYWKDLANIQQQWKIERVFNPAAANSTGLVEGWQKAVKAARYWAEL